MRYLALALYAEGPSDHVFLQRLLYRLTHEVATANSDTAVEIAETFFRGKNGPRGRTRADMIIDQFGEAIESSTINLLFIHSDGGGDALNARRNNIDPAVAELRHRYSNSLFECIPVVPVRETEAWALADPEALREEFGTRRTAAQLGLDLTSREVESLLDPKDRLQRAQEMAKGGRRTRLKHRRHGIPAALGERISISALRALEAFRSFETELIAAVRRLWNPPTHAGK